jgi:hypothetical protein
MVIVKSMKTVLSRAFWDTFFCVLFGVAFGLAAAVLRELTIRELAQGIAIAVPIVFAVWCRVRYKEYKIVGSTMWESPQPDVKLNVISILLLVITALLIFPLVVTYREKQAREKQARIAEEKTQQRMVECRKILDQEDEYNRLTKQQIQRKKPLNKNDEKINRARLDKLKEAYCPPFIRSRVLLQSQ